MNAPSTRRSPIRVWFATVLVTLALLALAALKVVALSLCLASGWLGGAVFPLLLAGASAGLACVV